MPSDQFLSPEMVTAGQLPLRLPQTASDIAKLGQNDLTTMRPTNTGDDAIVKKPIFLSPFLMRLETPSSASAPSSSSPSAAFMTLADAIATTPLSSLDGLDGRSPYDVMHRTIIDVMPNKGTVKANVQSGATRSSCRNENDSQSPHRGEAAYAPLPGQFQTAAQATDSALHRAQTGPQFLGNMRRQNKRPSSDVFVNTGQRGKDTGQNAAGPLTKSALASPGPPLLATPEPLIASVTETLFSKPGLLPKYLSRNTISESQVVTPLPTLARPRFSQSPPPPPQQPAIVRTASSHGKLPLRQPMPDANVRSGAFAGSIAQLEASAERLSMTSSIDDAIREEHQELKRSDSRRSSLLSATRQAAAQTVSDSNPPPKDASPFQPRPAFSRQNSIIELNSTLRTAGCFSPSDNIMSSNSSVSGIGLRRSGSKASSLDSGGILTSASDQPATSNSGPPFISRHGPGKSSVHSSRPGPLTLPEIAETEPPMTLTQGALDDADRLTAAGEGNDEEDAICALAHQDVVPDPIPISELNAHDLTPSQDTWEQPVMFSTNLQSTEHGSMAFDERRPYDFGIGGGPNRGSRGEAIRQGGNFERPTSSASIGTFEQAEAAFGDFDGVHCDPDAANDRSASEQLQADAPQPAQLPRSSLSPRPTSYFDPGSGRQMLYYPARVPAMLSLPPKLSKKPKAAERNNRRSKVLSMMFQTESESRGEPHQTRTWLPDPLVGNQDSPLLDTEEFISTKAIPAPSPAGAMPAALQSPESLIESSSTPNAADRAIETDMKVNVGIAGNSTIAGPSSLNRPPRLVDSERRKTRVAALNSLPPQLRASAFFDQPASAAEVQVKNGSAMDTLDSILDAAASAPVSAFTDHAFAGRLGAEIYGTGRKRDKRSTIAFSGPSGSPGEGKGKSVYADRHSHVGSKSRGSFISLVGHIRRVSEPVRQAGDKQSITSLSNRHQDVLRDDARDGALPGLEGDGSVSLLAPEEDEQSAEEDADADVREDGEGRDKDETDDENDAYEGAPTTLLAELQLRKQQQKLRTQPTYKAFPNGMHSTLLELDAVAEVERKARKGKRVNLAWEDPSVNPADGGDDDEDIPLGLLYAARAAGHNDVSAVVAEMSRPLGLLERKELEDNEPLSRRRDRLQGRNPGVGMYLTTGDKAPKRQSMLTLTPIMATLNSSGSLATSNRQVSSSDLGDRATDVDDEVGEDDNEPLAARLRRIKAKEESELPRARPVSTAFSAELLSHFGDPEEDAKDGAGGQDKGKAKDGTKSWPREEEEETLGQRRRRLQTEKEAREAEMLHSGGTSSVPSFNNQALHALMGANRPTRRFSMANVLSAHPLETARGLQHPREVERQERENLAARAAHGKEQKMTAMHAQLPQTVYTSNSLLLQTAGPVLSPWQTHGGIAGPSGSAMRLNSLAAVNSTVGMGAYPGNMGSGLGTTGMRANTMAAGYGYNQNYGAGQSQTMGMGMSIGMGMTAGPFSGTGFAVGVGGNPYPGYANQSSSMQVQMPASRPMQMPVPPPGQVDRVERWRQSVMP